MDAVPDPDRYFDQVLVHASPGVSRLEVRPAAVWQAWWRTRARSVSDPAQHLAATQGFTATTAQLNELGWQRHDNRRVRRRGEWHAVRTGVSSPVRIDDGSPAAVVLRRRHALESAAATLCRPGHAISGRSGAVVHGLPTVHVPGRPELTVIGTSVTTSGARATGHVFDARLDADAVTSWFGAPVTTVERTLVDLARHSRDDAIMAIDAALRERLVTVAGLRAELQRAAGWPGVRQARSIVDLARPDAESPLESLVRLRLHDDGFPAPRLQVGIADPARRRTYRVDLLIDEARLVVEADGRVKYDRDELWQEKRREARLRALGYQVERVLWSDVFSGWAQMRERLWVALRGGRTSPATAARFTPC